MRHFLPVSLKAACLAFAAGLASVSLSAAASADRGSEEAKSLPVAPKPVKRLAPGYPDDARRNRISGEVVGALSIDDDGDVERVEILVETPTGHGFGEAATDAFREWQFPAGAAGRYRVRIVFAPPEPAPEEAARLPPAPRPIERVNPKYPDEAAKRGVGGIVEVAVDIARDGSVAAVGLIEENPPGFGFGKATLTAVRQWGFAPMAEAARYSVIIRMGMSDGRGRAPDEGPQHVFVPDEMRPAPVPTRARKPGYPTEALRRGIAGTVDFAIQIDRQGRVTEIAVTGENPADMGFSMKAFDAVRRWRFPEGQPGAYTLQVAFDPANP